MDGEDSPSVRVLHKHAMVIVNNVVVAASRRVPEFRQRLVDGGQRPHGGLVCGATQRRETVYLCHSNVRPSWTRTQESE
jgi:hypothetical protein